MARATFISYKYSEARPLRDQILQQLGDDARYYRGETADSPNLTSTSVENIKSNLRDMIYGTSVTVVIISPNMIRSEWMEWEIEYSLKEINREGRASKTNGLLGVVMEINHGYEWLFSQRTNPDGCSSRSTNSSYLFNIINNNRFNLITENKYSCPVCRTFNKIEGSYISLIEENLFLRDPSWYIENAYEKSCELWKYKICKEK